MWTNNFVNKMKFVIKICIFIQMLFIINYVFKKRKTFVFFFTTVLSGYATDCLYSKKKKKILLIVCSQKAKRNYTKDEMDSTFNITISRILVTFN